MVDDVAAAVLHGAQIDRISAQAVAGLVDLRVVDAEHVDERRAQSVARGGAVEVLPVPAEDPPRLPGIRLGAPAHAQIRQVLPVGVQQPRQAVVRADEQVRGARERGVVGDHGRRHMAERGHDGQVLDIGQQAARDGAGGPDEMRSTLMTCSPATAAG
ncbi:hypothetical protein [Kocuria palustris]|uniref:hypothetical protein n=1 Tax=Kocuria palustris TaxID=71999 RepID=UPI003BF7C675